MAAVAGGSTGARETSAENAVFAVLLALSFSHMFNDLNSSLVPSLYPNFKASYGLNFAEVGLITLVNQATASLFQPFIGLYTDRHPMAYSLPLGMCASLIGILLMAMATSFTLLLVAVALVGVGAAVFHPEASRIARNASGGRHGLAQSLFQVGGNLGSAIGPLAVALVIAGRTQERVAWFAIVPLLAIVLLYNISRWHQRHTVSTRTKAAAARLDGGLLSRRRTGAALLILLVLIFSKYIYMASLTSYYTFYLIDRFHVSVQNAQLHLFVFLAAVAVGTLVGGPIGDRYGRKYVIWGSILGVCPFTLALPYVNLLWTGILSIAIGLILSSAFSAIVVYGTELIPGKVGMIAGLFFGLAFGTAGVAAAALGELADMTSLAYVYHLCAFLPIIGAVAAFLPDLDRPRTAR